MTGMATLKKKHIPITVSVLLGFSVCATIANLILDYNYMFLVRGDGTPYEILYALVKGHSILYPLGMILLFIVYILIFYDVYFLVCSKKRQQCLAPVAQTDSKTL